MILTVNELRTILVLFHDASVRTDLPCFFDKGLVCSPEPEPIANLLVLRSDSSLSTINVNFDWEIQKYNIDI